MGQVGLTELIFFVGGGSSCPVQKTLGCRENYTLTWITINLVSSNYNYIVSVPLYMMCIRFIANIRRSSGGSIPVEEDFERQTFRPDKNNRRIWIPHNNTNLI